MKFVKYLMKINKKSLKNTNKFCLLNLKKKNL